MVVVFVTACKDEELQCDPEDNAKIDGQCYWGFMKDYDVSGQWDTEGQLTELQKEDIEIEFRGNGPTYTLLLHAGSQKLNEAKDDWIYENGLLEEGRTYTNDTDEGTTLLENGHSGGDFSVTITKVDRQNKLISGYFKWNLSRQNSQLEFVDDVVEGEFNDVVAGIIEFP